MKKKLTAMWSIFKNDNDWNEKSIVGFIAFMIMCVFALLDLLTGYAGKDLVINETLITEGHAYVYDGGKKKVFTS